MPTLTIEDKQFDMDTLNDKARSLVTAVSFCDSRIQALEAELMMAKTARIAYVKDLLAQVADTDATKTPKKPATRKRAASKAKPASASKTKH